MSCKTKFLVSFFTLFLSGILCFSFSGRIDDQFITYTVNPKEKKVNLYWKDERDKNLYDFQQLKSFIEKKNQTLIFAMNGGMFMEDFSPLGLYIENQKTHRSLNSSAGYGNFYLKPNGVFYITTEKTAKICKTEDFKPDNSIRFATQSGPMLLVDGEIHRAFQKNSTNLNVRNGVGLLPDNQLVFVMSKGKINFYDFAAYFKKLGCKNALYLDGFVSRTYYPEKKWIQTDGKFGVMIGVSEYKK